MSRKWSFFILLNDDVNKINSIISACYKLFWQLVQFLLKKKPEGVKKKEVKQISSFVNKDFIRPEKSKKKLGGNEHETYKHI
jgi:hypothetical protein